MPRQPRTQRLDALWRAVAMTPDRTAEYYAITCHISRGLATLYLAELERGHQIVSRIETYDEAHTRCKGERRSSFTRAYTRRKLRYGVRVAGVAA